VNPPSQTVRETPAKARTAAAASDAAMSSRNLTFSAGSGRSSPAVPMSRKDIPALTGTPSRVSYVDIRKGKEALNSPHALGKGAAARDLNELALEHNLLAVGLDQRERKKLRAEHL
jgi:hypothetical protein